MKPHTKALIEILQPIDPDYGAEVGVWRGENAAALLLAFPTLNLYAVDAYDNSLMTGKQLNLMPAELAYREASIRTKFAGSRCEFICLPSSQAITAIGEPLDFAFIDASHDYENVKVDIRAWSPLIREGGILCGHDYGGTWKGVKQAVDEEFGTRVKTGPKRSRVWWVTI